MRLEAGRLRLEPIDYETETLHHLADLYVEGWITLEELENTVQGVLRVRMMFA